MDPAEGAARERLETFFRAIDRLTPDELARIGFRPAPDEEREAHRAAIDAAAVRTGRVALVAEAREAAIAAMTRRYADGSFHPTFVGLNWGLSQGTVSDRVAIATALADAAAAAVVADALDPEVADALAVDAAAILDLAGGEASEGSLARVLRDPADADLRPGPRTRRARGLVAATAVVVGVVTVGIGMLGAAAAALVAGARAVVRGRTGGGDRAPD